MNRLRSHPVTLLVIAATCALPALAQPSRQPFIPSNRSTVLTGAAARDIFRACSRTPPRGVTGYWEPTRANVATLEADLRRFLAARQPAASVRQRGLQDDFHQYVGFRRGGRQWVYVNAFAPAIAKQMGQSTLVVGPRQGRKFDWRRDGVDACDGGSYFWGIEYDLQARTFHNLQFNGPLGGKY